MRKLRFVAKDVSKIADVQDDTVRVMRAMADILTRGFWGRMRWLFIGR